MDMIVKPYEGKTPTLQPLTGWGVYDRDSGKLLAPCETEAIAKRWKRLHQKEARADGQ